METGEVLRIKAQTTLLPDGNLEVSVQNTSVPGVDGLAVIFSLRCSHPKLFSPLEPTLPDGVLLPGEQRKVLLSGPSDCAEWNRFRSDNHDVNSRLGSTITELFLGDANSGVRAHNPSGLPANGEKESAQDPQPLPPQQATSKSPTNTALSGGDESTVGNSFINRYRGKRLPKRAQPATRYEESSTSSSRRLHFSYGAESNEKGETPSTPKRRQRKREDGFTQMGPLMDPNGPLGPLDTSDISKNTFAKAGLHSNYNSASDVLLLSPSLSSVVKPCESGFDFSDLDSTSQPPFPITVANTPNNSLQCPCFFVYYGKLGTEATYVKNAMAWLNRERDKYAIWRQNVLRYLKERGESESSLPPLLGEPVRWLKNMDGAVSYGQISKLYRNPYSRSSAKMFARHRRGNGCVMVPYRPPRGDPASVNARNELSGLEPDKDLPSKNSDETKMETGRQDGSESMAVNHENDGCSTSAVVCPTNTTTSVNSPPSHDEKKSGDGVSKTEVSSGQWSLMSPLDAKFSASARLLEEDSGGCGQLPSLATFDCPINFHVRTETEETVEMLDHTVCGEDYRDCRNKRQRKRKHAKKHPSDAEPIEAKSSDIVTFRHLRESRSGSNLEGMFAGPSGRCLENNPSTDEVRRSPVLPTTSEKERGRSPRCRVETREEDGACVGRKQSSFSAPRRGSLSFICKVPPGGDLCISQVGDALRNIAVKSAPLMQTAMGGTVSTVTTTAQLFFGVIEDSIDILHAICLPVLSLFSLFLLWMAFGPTDDEDVMISTMNLFA
ncbi:hypothetical protein MOQ_001168 [Trypanosoma cruzi marinkellei]|uniref:Uncharacterized protein n=1 Tax=Trypanosoma cruzi marinkellei TaxID=85056 RepID=K2NUH9_TRYCR|nr:hypothetical protein MOQ_001168 [Trypanosoma cruzi marinkellei]